MAGGLAAAAGGCPACRCVARTAYYLFPMGMVGKRLGRVPWDTPDAWGGGRLSRTPPPRPPRLIPGTPYTRVDGTGLLMYDWSLVSTGEESLMKQRFAIQSAQAALTRMRLRAPPGKGISGYQVFAFLVICFLFWPLALFLVLRFVLAVIRGYQEGGGVPTETS
jgi:hypothetical protein